MKTKSSIIPVLAAAWLAMNAGVAILHATDAAQPHPCCSGCAAKADEMSDQKAQPLSARSIYQLDQKWVNDDGVSFSLASLRGRPVVVAMFFTRCEYACPVTVSDMQRLRAALPPAARASAQFVLVSFDSARDTPAALKAYRERALLDSGWTLLHGDPAAVQDLAMVLGVKYREDARGQFAHSNVITILNAEGEVAHQVTGLMADISEAVKVVTAATGSRELALR